MREKFIKKFYNKNTYIYKDEKQYENIFYS